MRKRDIVKLVFVVIFTLVAIFSCVISISTAQTIAEGGEQIDSGAEAVAFTFVAIFGVVGALIFAANAVICDVVSAIICLFGFSAPAKAAKIVFALMRVANVIIALVSIFVPFNSMQG